MAALAAAATLGPDWPERGGSLLLAVAVAASILFGVAGFVGTLVVALAAAVLQGGLPLGPALLVALASTVPAGAGVSLLRPRSCEVSLGRAALVAAAIAAVGAVGWAYAVTAGAPAPWWGHALRAFPGFFAAAALPVAVLRVAGSSEHDHFVAIVLENLPVVVFMKDPRGRYCVVNRCTEEVLGRSRREIIGHTDDDLFPPDVAAQLKGEDAAVLGTRRVLQMEQELPVSAGLHTFLVSKFPLPHRLGGRATVGGVASDITELRRLTRALQESEGRLRDVIEHSSNLFYVHTPEHVFTYVSPQSRHFFGCEPEEAKVSWTDFVPDPESRERAMVSTERALATGVRQPPYEIEVVGRSGRALWVEVNEAPVVREGRTVAIVGALTDIDERRRAEQGRRRALSLLEAALESVGEGLLVVDRNGRIARYNQRFIEMWGVSPALLATADDRAVIAYAKSKLADPNAFVERVEALYARPDAEDMDVLELADGRTFERYSRPQRLDGEVVGRVWSFRDVTARRTAEVELRRHRDHLAELVEERTRELTSANQELETFCYTVSHDLRTPLRAIDGFSRILAEEERDRLDPAGAAHLARIRAAVGRMARLIDDLLELSRVSRCLVRHQQVDLGELAEAVVVDLRAADPDRAVEVTIERGLVAEGDATLLRSLLQNLLDNAWKFSVGRTPAHIHVGARDEGGERAFFVRDDGAGFDMAYAARLFNPFERLHSPQEFEGTGIGLATVQRIVQRHGGRVWAESAVGKGATFYFTLPGRKNGAAAE